MYQKLKNSLKIQSMYNLQGYSQPSVSDHPNAQS